MEILKKTTIARIEAQTRDRPANEVRRISLSGVPLLPEQLTPFAQLTHLTLVSMKPMLTTLTAIPFAQLGSLRSLDVSDNAIVVANDEEGDANNDTDGESAGASYPSLKQLIMPNNRVQTMDELRRLSRRFPALEVLDLEDNPVDTADQRESIFDLFSELTTLDCRTRSGEEVVVVHSDELSEESGSEADDEDEEDEEESSSDEADMGQVDYDDLTDEEDYDSDDEEEGELDEDESDASEMQSEGEQPGSKRFAATGRRDEVADISVSRESEGGQSESNSEVAQDGEGSSDVKRARVEKSDNE